MNISNSINPSKGVMICKQEFDSICIANKGNQEEYIRCWCLLDNILYSCRVLRVNDKALCVVYYKVIDERIYAIQMHNSWIAQPTKRPVCNSFISSQRSKCDMFCL